MAFFPTVLRPTHKLFALTIPSSSPIPPTLYSFYSFYPLTTYKTNRPAIVSLSPINLQSYRLTSTLTSTPTSTSTGKRSSDIEALLHREACQKVKQRLLEGTKQVIPVNDYFLLTKNEFGLSVEESKQLLRSLHDAGVILYLPESTNPRLRDSIFINPQEVTEYILKSLNLYIPQLSKEEIENLRKEYLSLTKIKDKLDLKAENRSDFWIWTGFGYCVLQGAVLARLTWWEFSWDVMEPITYFITFGTGLLSYMYFATLKSEYTYDNLRERLIKKRRQRYYNREENFSIDRWIQLHDFFKQFDAQPRSLLDLLDSKEKSPK